MNTNTRLIATAAAAAALCLLIPSVAMAAGDGDTAGYLTTVIFQLLNVLLLLALGFYYGRKPFSKFLKDRKERVTKELEEAKKLREEARAALARYRSRLDSLDSERDSILQEYRRMGQKERERIIEDAHAQAERIANDAQMTVDSEILRAKAALEAEVVTLAASLAETTIREQLDRNKQRALVDTYLEDLESTFGDDAISSKPLA